MIRIVVKRISLQNLLKIGLVFYCISFSFVVIIFHQDHGMQYIPNVVEHAKVLFQLEHSNEAMRIAGQEWKNSVHIDDDDVHNIVNDNSSRSNHINNIQNDYSKKLHRNQRTIMHGRVMKELCKRVLSRDIAQSNVLIISPDVKKTTMLYPNNNHPLSQDDRYQAFETHNGPSKVVLSTSLEENHHTYIVPPSKLLNDWWQEDIASFSEKANWFLLSYFIPGNAHDNDIDTILHQNNVGRLLNDATLTYIVFEVKAQYVSNGTLEYSGLHAIQTLLDANYKVQLLASSHFDEKAIYRPNHLFKTQIDAQKFLLSGAEVASQHDSGECEGKQQLDANGEECEGQFHSLLFATQGLDLAIPSRLSYLTLENLDLCANESSGRCDSKLDARALGQSVFLSCPSHHKNAFIEFDESSPYGVRLSINGNIVTKDERNEKVDLWLGHKDSNQAEVACMRGKLVGHDSDTINSPVSCTTRILKEPNDNLSSPSKPQMNLLSILIDPISRSQFKRSLPNTLAILETLGFVYFPKYTVVGSNSGPNQAALFTGVSLVDGREGIKSSQSHGSNDPIWIWDQLRDERNYKTLKAEDICIKNTNMVQSIKPTTSHGDQLYRMFCFDFDRPNCVGKDMAAQHVIDYTHKFMAAYSGTNKEKHQPWAAFISFVDSHEDSMTLISYLDEMFVNFLQAIDLTNTVVVLSSDHGLHYGPTFLSSGIRERAEPILYIHTPQHTIQETSLMANSEKWVSPFDVHQTIVDLFLRQKQEKSVGSSLLKPLVNRISCFDTPGVPRQFCSIVEPTKTIKKSCSFMSSPPSIYSFYADIPKVNKHSWPKCDREIIDHRDTEDCLCATNLAANVSDYWIPCDSPRFDKLESQWKAENEPLRMKTCRLKNSSQFTMEFNVTIEKKKKVLNRSKTYVRDLKSLSESLEPMPNILFIEIDSLSQAAAERHLVKTLSVIKSHQMKQSSSQEVVCPSGFCAAMFNKTSVIGQSSIPNQLAALSGCTDKPTSTKGFYKRDPIRKGLSSFYPEGLDVWCQKSDIENPWLYNIVGRLGYVTFFGDEFCFSQSPWVVQGNLFRTNPDYGLNQFFCQLAKAQIDQTSDREDSPKPLYAVEYDTSKNPQPCINGRSRQEIAFEHIRGMWNAYTNEPKFAYLNSLSAHDYSTDLAYQNLGVESYDDYLSAFLDEMLKRDDSSNTIIVIRSDHGIQGGPAPIDYSAQVEHMNPFNVIIIPQSFRRSRHNILYSNQNKLVTGYDLYNTLRYLIAPHSKDGSVLKLKNFKGHDTGIPDWSFNLLKDIVPHDRNCLDAMIPAEMCPCLEERSDLMPYFYVGKAEQLNKMEGLNFTQSSKTSKLDVLEVPGRKFTSS